MKVGRGRVCLGLLVSALLFFRPCLSGNVVLLAHGGLWLGDVADVGAPVVSSVACTLLLCIAAWAAYDWQVKNKDRKAEARENAERQGGGG